MSLKAPANELAAARQLEALVLERLFEATGAFKGSSLAGGDVRAGMFTQALAEAVADAGGLGLAGAITPSAVSNPSPVRDTHVTSPFGLREDPFDGHLTRHAGVDVAAREGDEIRALAGGVVRSAGTRGGYGDAVEIDHGGGVTTLYAHASQLLVKTGEKVEAGDPVALAGHTGRATGPHLHLELRVGGHAVDPTPALKAAATRVDGQERAR